MNLCALIVLFGLCGAHAAKGQEAKELRLGHFPNITHAQAVMAHANGKFEKEVGVPIRWTIFNAGPSAIEALMSGAIDAAYIGPNPAINGFLKTQGDGLRIVAGSAGGGAALVVRADAKIATDRDFAGKIVATPQLGNTQDVAARIWFQKKGHSLKEKGGNLTVLPLANPDQLLLFQKKEIDAAWTIEPWVSRLQMEANGTVLLDEKTLWPEERYVTTHLIVGRKFLGKNRGLVKRLIKAHVEITRQLNAELGSMTPILNAELKRETGKELPEAVIQSALRRMEFTWDPIQSSLYKSAEDAFRIGFLRQKPDLKGIYDLTLLNEVLQEKQLPPIP